MYVVIWPKHNIHGWTVFSFVVSMLVFFVTLAVVQITHITADLDILNTRPCLAVGGWRVNLENGEWFEKILKFLLNSQQSWDISLFFAPCLG